MLELGNWDYLIANDAFNAAKCCRISLINSWDVEATEELNIGCGISLCLIANHHQHDDAVVLQRIVTHGVRLYDGI